MTSVIQAAGVVVGGAFLLAMLVFMVMNLYRPGGSRGDETSLSAPFHPSPGVGGTAEPGDRGVGDC